MYFTFFFFVLHRTFIRLCCWESAKSCALHAKNVLTCQRVLHADMPCVLKCLYANCLACLRAHVPTNVSCVLRCSQTNVSCVLTYSRANVP